MSCGLIRSDYNSILQDKGINVLYVAVGFLKYTSSKIGSKKKKNSEDKEIKTPIILLTAKGEPTDRIQGLETGADDYLAKPFEPKELVLRINNILEKTKVINQKRVVNFSNINIDLNKSLIINNNKE